MAKRIVTDEELCASLMVNGTIKKTAEALSISERTVYNRMSENSFKEIWEFTQVGILNNCIVACQSRITEAIECIADIMNDKTVNAQTRLQAAQTLLKSNVSIYDAFSRRREEAEASHINAIWDATHR